MEAHMSVSSAKVVILSDEVFAQGPTPGADWVVELL